MEYNNQVVDGEYVDGRITWEPIKTESNTLHYVLFEDVVNSHTKYWVYEMFPHEIITVIDESVPSPNDFYIVSKNLNGL